MSNNNGTVTLTKGQMDRVAAGDMSPLSALMGKLPSTSLGTPSPGGAPVPLTKGQMSQVAAGDTTPLASLLGDLRSTALGVAKDAAAATKLTHEGAKLYEAVSKLNPDVITPLNAVPYSIAVDFKTAAPFEKIGKVSKGLSGIAGALQLTTISPNEGAMTNTINLVEGGGKVVAMSGAPVSGYSGLAGEGLRTVDAWNKGDVFGAAEHASAAVARGALGGAAALAAFPFSGPSGAAVAFDKGSSLAGGTIVVLNETVGRGISKGIDMYYSNDVPTVPVPVRATPPAPGGASTGIPYYLDRNPPPPSISANPPPFNLGAITALPSPSVVTTPSVAPSVRMP